MKNQQGSKANENAQGNPTSDRVFTDTKTQKKENGISNAGGQRSDQTSTPNTEHKKQSKKS